VRYFNHVGFAVTVGMDSSHLEEGDYQETIEHVASLLNLGSMFFTLGIRGYYFAIPFVFWYFGPFPLLVSTILLTAAVSYGDSNHGLKLSRTESKELIA
jgi:uncharacterized membrane protein